MGPSLGSQGSGIQSINLLPQDGRLVDLTGSATEDSLGKDLEVRVEEFEASKALETCRVSKEGKLALLASLKSFSRSTTFWDSQWQGLRRK